MIKQIVKSRRIGLVIVCGVMVVALLACGGSNSTSPPTEGASSSSGETLYYAVSLEDADTDEPIPNIIVRIDPGNGEAPLQGVTDSDGFTRIAFDESLKNANTRLKIRAEGYEPYDRAIDLKNNNATAIIRLEKSSFSAESPSTEPTETSTHAPSPTETTVPPSLTSIPTPQPAALSSTEIPTNGSFVVTKDNVTYTVSEAKYNGSELVLFFFAYNEGADKDNVCLRFSSSLIDASGVEHQQSDRIAGGRRGGGDCLPFDIPHAVPTRFGLAFDSVLPTVTHIPFVEVILGIGEGSIQFRDIPIPYETASPISQTEITDDPKLVSTLNDVTYTLVETDHGGSELILWFIAYNEGADKDNVCLRFSSSLIDASGVEHQQSDRIAGGRRGGGDCLPFDIPHAVPTRFGLAFDSVLPTVTHIPFVEVVLGSEGQVQFRNMPVPYTAE